MPEERILDKNVPVPPPEPDTIPEGEAPRRTLLAELAHECLEHLDWRDRSRLVNTALAVAVGMLLAKSGAVEPLLEAFQVFIRSDRKRK